jgi:FAD:protein FMN transferase
MQRRKFLVGGIGALASGTDWLYSPVANGQNGLQPGQRLFRAADLAFGTTVSVQVAHDNEQEARRAMEEALVQARIIDRLMSIYREGSQIHTLNERGQVDRPDPHLLTVLKASRRLSMLTGDAFDITVQPLWLASTGALDKRAARELVGWRDVQASHDAVRLLRAGMAITLNGIAQGYATDLALEAVRARGISSALVDIGEFASMGRRPDRTSWQVGIANPRAPARTIRTARLDGRSLATSGDYECTFSADYTRHHIVDPTTGESPTELAGVSVAAPMAMLADGLSTALMVMGSTRGLQLVDRLPGVDAWFIEKNGKQSWSRGFPLV